MAGSGNAHDAFWSISSTGSDAGRPDASTDRIALSPCWVAGRGDREINPRSPAEQDLARRTGVAYVRLPYEYVDRSRKPSNRSGTEVIHGLHGVNALVGDLSQMYDRRVFGVEPPDVPTTDAEVLLAVIVVAPELVALIVLLISTREWRVRDLWVLLFVFLSGCVATAGIISLAVREAKADAWRGAGVRHQLEPLIPDPGFGQPVPVARSETLLLVAGTGYRRVWLARLATGLSIAYVVTSVGVAAVVWALRRRSLRARYHGVEGGPEGGAAADPGGDAGKRRAARTKVTRGGPTGWRRWAVRPSRSPARWPSHRWCRPGRAAATDATAAEEAEPPPPTLPPPPTRAPPPQAPSRADGPLGAGHDGPAGMALGG